MITFLFSPWGIPANYRQMQGSGVNTYKWVNQDGVGVLVKYHWEPLGQGIKNLTRREAEAIQAKNTSHATQDLYEAIERGDYPEWKLCVQILSDDEHSDNTLRKRVRRHQNMVGSLIRRLIQPGQLV